MYKVDQKKELTIEQISEVLRNRTVLYDFSLEDKANKIILHIQTDSAVIELTKFSKKAMAAFLSELRNNVDQIDRDDVADLIEELDFIDRV